MARQLVDAGDRTYLPVCSCGWRGAVALLRSRAWAEAHRHGRAVHDDGEAARHAGEQAQLREAARAR